MNAITTPVVDTLLSAVALVALAGSGACCSRAPRERGAAIVAPSAPLHPRASRAASDASPPVIAGQPVDRVAEFEIASTGCSRHEFGESMAASGEMLLVGAPWRDYAVQKDQDTPSACLYRNTEGGWLLTQRAGST